MSIKVTIKNVYGNDLIYPMCEKAQRFAELTRKKTLDTRDLEIIKRLGYVVEVVPYFSTGKI